MYSLLHSLLMTKKLTYERKQTSEVVKTYDNSKTTLAIVIVFSCIVWSHCYTLYTYKGR